MVIHAAIAPPRTRRAIGFVGIGNHCSLCTPLGLALVRASQALGFTQNWPTPKDPVRQCRSWLRLDG